MARASKVLARAGLAFGLLAALDIGLSLTLLRNDRVGVRPMPPFGALTDPEQLAALERIEGGEESPTGVTEFDRELGWCVRAGAASANGRTHVTDQGLRGVRSYAPAPAPGTLRLACFGDSFTFGDETSDGETWEAQLEMLDARIEALNFGVPAYGTDQALLRMRREGIRGAHAVVVGLLLENIGRNVNRYRPLWYPRTQTPLAKPRLWLDGERLEVAAQPFASARELAAAVRVGSVIERIAAHEYWLDRPAVPTGRWSSLVRLACGFLAYRERDPERLWLDGDGGPRRVTIALLEAFRREALAAGARECVVIVMPMKQEFEEYVRTGRAYWSPVLAELAARGIPHLDAAAALAAEEARLASESRPESVFAVAHLSPLGNQVLARALLSWLSERRHVFGRQ